MLSPSSNISIHAPLAGSDLLRTPLRGIWRDFDPRSPCGERQSNHRVSQPPKTFRSTLPLRGATVEAPAVAVLAVISIHAPLAGSDLVMSKQNYMHVYFDPRSPCGERPMCESKGRFSYDFDPRSPCGERRDFVRRLPDIRYFDPRSPCGERRLPGRVQRIRRHFDPRSPCGERQEPRLPDIPFNPISIHAPLAGSDRIFLQSNFRHDISIHAPLAGSDTFLSSESIVFRISIHAPLAGSDFGADLSDTLLCDFDPRSPCGERPEVIHIHVLHVNFDPRSPCGERLTPEQATSGDAEFRSTLPLRGATAKMDVFVPRNETNHPHAATQSTTDGHSHISTHNIDAFQLSSNLEKSEHQTFNNQYVVRSPRKSLIASRSHQNYRNQIIITSSTGKCRCLPRYSIFDEYFVPRL